MMGLPANKRDGRPRRPRATQKGSAMHPSANVVSRRVLLKNVGVTTAAIAASATLGPIVNPTSAKATASAPEPDIFVPTATETCSYTPDDSPFPTCDPYMYAPCGAGVGEVAFVAEPIPEDQIIATHAVDVVVCGLGPAGDAAALSCAEHGLKTVAVEKRAFASYCSSTLGGTDSGIHKYWGVEYDKKELTKDYLGDGGYRVNGEVFQRYLEKNGEAVDWYISHFEDQDPEHYPLTMAAYDFPEFRDQYADTCTGRSWNTSFNLPYSPAELSEMFPKMIEAAGAEVRFECPAVQLITEEGRVTGVIVKSADGYEKYSCAKGVVLATGGYEFNPEKLARCCRPRDLALCGWITPSNGNTGDGHEMALAVGGVEDEYPHPLMLDPMNLMPFLRVNKLGLRFVGEYEPYNRLSCAIQAQPGAFCWYVVDSALPAKIDSIWTACSSCWGAKQDWIDSALDPEAYLPWRGGTRTMVIANTIEELAEKMGIDVDGFVATIEKWNAMCDAGIDTDFYFPGEMMYKIDEPPFYATLEGAESLTTVGGLQVDKHSRVLNANAKPIEGLFALGLTSGSMFYNTYPHLINCLSHTRNCTFGYMIGLYLSGDKN